MAPDPVAPAQPRVPNDMVISDALDARGQQRYLQRLCIPGTNQFDVERFARAYAWSQSMAANGRVFPEQRVVTPEIRQEWVQTFDLLESQMRHLRNTDPDRAARIQEQSSSLIRQWQQPLALPPITYNT